VKSKRQTKEDAMIDIFIFGQRYEVPEELTILKAFEWAGFQLTRGVGCRVPDSCTT
jgi:hypothetical protein